jgi:hypothetical protein
METQLNIKEFIIGIESKYPVSEWKINGIHIWPYIRIKLYIQLLSSVNSKKETTFTESAPVFDKKSKISYLKKGFHFILAPFLYFIFVNRLKRKSFVFFGAHFHRVFLKGLYFNKFFDSWIYLNQLQERHYTFEYLKTFPNVPFSDHTFSLTLQLEQFQKVQKIIAFFWGKQRKELSIELKEYDSFITYLEQGVSPNIVAQFNQDKLCKWVLKIFSLLPFFENVYKKVQPEYVAFAGYYGYDQLYAAILQANRMGIRTIDFQHGPQTNTHMVFSDWTQLPKAAHYDLMPKEYWNWDGLSVKNIEKWSVYSQSINAVEIGQPFISYCKKHFDGVPKKEDYFIYTLQTRPFSLQDLFPDSIIEAIKKSPCKWILRLHPRSYFTKDELELFLKNKGIISNFEIQSALDDALPFVLSGAKLHITNFSGCVIEAKMLGVPTVIVHQMGKEMFEAYIDNEVIIYFDIHGKEPLNEFILNRML